MALWTHPETAVWQTRWPAARVWVWTGWGLGSKHLAEPVKAMRRSDRAQKSVNGGCTAILRPHQYFSCSHFIQQPELWIIFFPHLPRFKEKQTSVRHRKRPKRGGEALTKLLKEMETLSGKRAACWTAWRWHLNENSSLDESPVFDRNRKNYHWFINRKLWQITL